MAAPIFYTEEEENLIQSLNFSFKLSGTKLPRLMDNETAFGCQKAIYKEIDQLIDLASDGGPTIIEKLEELVEEEFMSRPKEPEKNQKKVESLFYPPQPEPKKKAKETKPRLSLESRIPLLLEREFHNHIVIDSYDVLIKTKKGLDLYYSFKNKVHPRPMRKAKQTKPPQPEPKKKATETKPVYIINKKAYKMWFKSFEKRLWPSDVGKMLLEFSKHSVNLCYNNYTVVELKNIKYTDGDAEFLSILDGLGEGEINSQKQTISKFLLVKINTEDQKQWESQAEPSPLFHSQFLCFDPISPDVHIERFFDKKNEHKLNNTNKNSTQVDQPEVRNCSENLPESAENNPKDIFSWCQMGIYLASRNCSSTEKNEANEMATRNYPSTEKNESSEMATPNYPSTEKNESSEMDFTSSEPLSAPGDPCTSGTTKSSVESSDEEMVVDKDVIVDEDVVLDDADSDEAVVVDTAAEECRMNQNEEVVEENVAVDKAADVDEVEVVDKEAAVANHAAKKKRPIILRHFVETFQFEYFCELKDKRIALKKVLTVAKTLTGNLSIAQDEGNPPDSLSKEYTEVGEKYEVDKIIHSIYHKCLNECPSEITVFHKPRAGEFKKIFTIIFKNNTITEQKREIPEASLIHVSYFEEPEKSLCQKGVNSTERKKNKSRYLPYEDISGWFEFKKKYKIEIQGGLKNIVENYKPSNEYIMFTCDDSAMQELKRLESLKRSFEEGTSSLQNNKKRRIEEKEISTTEPNAITPTRDNEQEQTDSMEIEKENCNSVCVEENQEKDHNAIYYEVSGLENCQVDTDNSMLLPEDEILESDGNSQDDLVLSCDDADDIQIASFSDSSSSEFQSASPTISQYPKTFEDVLKMCLEKKKQLEPLTDSNEDWYV